MITLDSDPQLNPVNIGAVVLSYMKGSDFTELDPDQIYNDVKDNFNLSYDVFVYTLDWLFIIGAINLNSEGRITYAPA